jgi:hypothetical protein
MHERVKSSRREAMFGLHIWHNFTLSPLYRAEQDLAELARCSDFFKVALYGCLTALGIASGNHIVGFCGK